MLSELEKELFHAAHSLAEVVNVSSSTVIRHLQDSLGMKDFHLH
jgi:DNA-binding MurR/RpiR family transcriptional regulator